MGGFDIVGGVPVARTDHVEAATLAAARAAVPPTADYCLARSPQDDPAVVESWI